MMIRRPVPGPRAAAAALAFAVPLALPLVALSTGPGAPWEARAEAATLPGGAISAAIADPARPPEDRARDADRKPDALLAFAGIRPGMAVADILPGKGYFTRLFSLTTGKTGHVWAVVPPWLLKLKPTAADSVQALSRTPQFANVSVVTTSLDKLSFPQPLDVVWTSQNYHDVYYGNGPDAALAFDKAAFAALRPGGTFIVIDHAATPQAAGDIHKLHRIDPALVRKQVESAGFVLEAQSDVLANAHDPHDIPVFDPAIRGHTDQFVLKFRKPAP